MYFSLFLWSASSSYSVLTYGRFYRLNNTTPHRLVKLGLNPTACILAAALGNTAGGMTCYYMGRLGKISWIEKYFKVKKEKVDKMMKFLQGKGALMAFFAFLPAVGEVISIALGFMRSNVWLTTASMFAGKLIRYILLLYVLESAWNVVAG